jgi:hypothetical protein
MTWTWQEKELEVTWELVGLAMGQGQAAGEMEYDGRESGIGASAGMEGDMGRTRADRGWWETETGGIDVV